MAVEVQKLCVLFYYQQSLSLGSGYPLVYWEWYRTATAEMVEGSHYVSQTLNGYAPQEMSVSPCFGSLKEETLETGLLSPQIFNLFVVKKAAEYLKTRKVKSIKCRGADDSLHYDIPKDSPLSPKHLHALILWCDFIKFRVKLIESLSGDDLADVKSENSKFFFVSKSLRELVAYFGSDGKRYSVNGQVKGPFYCASREVGNLSGFCIGFNIPTATTKMLPVALRMAGPQGTVMTVGKQSGRSRCQPLFDTTWISMFFEEDEYLWFGSLYPLRVEDVFPMETARSYRSIIGLLYIFDAAVSGKIERGMSVTAEEMKKLDFCLKYARNENMENEDVPDGVDEYILDSVKAFCAKKRKLTLSMHGLSKLHESMRNMIFYGLSKRVSIPSDRTNIFRSELFVQFPSLVQIEMDTTMGYGHYGGACPLNLISLLSVLDEANIPDCFQVLQLSDDNDYDDEDDSDDVEDSGAGWIGDAFTSNIKEQFTAKNWNIEMKRMEYQDSIIITRM